MSMDSSNRQAGQGGTMADLAIRVENLGKRYRIGTRERYKTLRDDLSSAFTAPFRAVAKPFRPHSQDSQDHNGANDTERDRFWALKDFSLEIAQGETVGIIGSNGAGKTTLLKILSRITKPTEGQVTINGRVSALLEVGSGFHPELTGRENIYLNAAIIGMSREEVRRNFDDIVAFAEVEQFIETPLKHYSSGMHMRLAFAVAAYLEPEVLLVDEILAVGDVNFQKKCLGKMEDVARAGRTVLFVSHNMSAVRSLCFRGVLLEKGQIALDDTADKVVAHYLSSLQKYQLPTNGKIALEQHPGRTKQFDGPLRVTHCGLQDGSQQSVTSFRSGDEARITIGYDVTALQSSGSVVFILRFKDGLQQCVFVLTNELVGYEFEGLKQTGEVLCVIPKLPLAPGTYSVDVGCKVGSSWSDFVYEAIRVEIASGEFFPTGMLPPTSWGNTLVEHYWDQNS